MHLIPNLILTNDIAQWLITEAPPWFEYGFVSAISLAWCGIFGVLIHDAITKKKTKKSIG